MKGYIRNKMPVWRHAFKRNIGPNYKIELDELYKQYGVKHDIPEGKPFINWLKTVKIKDLNEWEIFYEDVVEEKSIDKKIEKNQSENTVPVTKKEKTIEDVINMSVRDARSELKKINNLKLLKYSYSQARQLANKDTLCRMLNKRIKELELTK